MNDSTAGKRTFPALSNYGTSPRCLGGATLLILLSLVSSPNSAHPADITDAHRLLLTGEYRACAELCGQAIEDGEYSESWRIYKMEADLASGHYEDAAETLEAALQRFRTSIRVRWLGTDVYRWNGQIDRVEELLKEIDQLTDGASWRYSDPLSRVVLGRFYLYRGADPKVVLDEVYGAVKQRTRSFSEPFVAAGELALEKHDYAMAADEFQEALAVDSRNPHVHFGLAMAYAPSNEAKTQEHLQAALKLNPQHADSLLFLVDRHIDAERYEDAAEVIRQVLEVNPTNAVAWSYLAVLAHLRNDPIGERVCRALALAWWSTNPEVDYTIGRKLSQKYRFAEGADYQRRALEVDPTYVPSKIELSQDLLRLGQEKEGWRLAEEVYEDDAYNVVAHNLTTLRDELDGFRTLNRDGIFVRMTPREAEIYGERVLTLLEEAKGVLCGKYDVQLEKPVLVEVFPEQQDFAIRTFGLPGGEGFLGVCFGNVITANSPASQAATPTSWESVLWHEFCHVVTLNKTDNKMPRWLSEGISVYEELQRNPAWGQSLSPTYREMILNGELTPVSELSAAFLNPPSPLHLQFAYFEAGLVIEYIVDQYGQEMLERVLVDLQVGMPLNDALQRYTGSLAGLDREFADFVTQRAKQQGGQLDWERPDFPPGMTLRLYEQWNRDHPDNFWGLQTLAVERVKAKRWEAAKEPLLRLRELYPEYAGDDSSYVMLAAVHRELGETEQERAVLEALVLRRSDAVDAYVRLMEIGSEQEDWELVLTAAEQMLAVNPLQRPPHRYLAKAAEAVGDSERATAGLQVLAALGPHDPADVHYRLAVHLAKLGKLPQARRHILMALEDAPRFRAAHQTLLEILAAIEQNEATPKAPPEDSPAEADS